MEPQKERVIEETMSENELPTIPDTKSIGDKRSRNKGKPSGVP
jgi:hypothetical protein